MKRNSFIKLASLSLAGLIVGCSGTPDKLDQFKNPTYAIDGMRHSAAAMTMAKKTYDSVDTLLDRSQVKIDPSVNLLSTSIVDVSDIEKSSSLGRMISEQISGRISQLGYRVAETKLRVDLAVNNQGEMILSRTIDDLAKHYDAQAVVTGTYAVGSQYIHINLKLTALDDGQILSSVDYVLSANEWYQRDNKILVGQ